MIVGRTGEALAEPHDELLRCVRLARAVNIDETGWRTAGARRILWGALSARAALFRIAEGRHQREAEALLGPDFFGIACSDRWWAYDYLDPQRRQLCSRPSRTGLHRPQRGPGRAEALRPGGPRDCRTAVRGLKTATAVACSNGWAHWKRSSGRCSRGGAKERQDQALPDLREQPAHALARSLDPRHRPRGRADQQPRRARPARGGHLPQALPGQPVCGRGAHH